MNIFEFLEKIQSSRASGLCSEEEEKQLIDVFFEHISPAYALSHISYWGDKIDQEKREKYSYILKKRTRSICERLLEGEQIYGNEEDEENARSCASIQALLDESIKEVFVKKWNGDADKAMKEIWEWIGADKNFFLSRSDIEKLEEKEGKEGVRNFFSQLQEKHPQLFFSNAGIAIPFYEEEEIKKSILETIPYVSENDIFYKMKDFLFAFEDSQYQKQIFEIYKKHFLFPVMENEIWKLVMKEDGERRDFLVSTLEKNPYIYFNFDEKQREEIHSYLGGQEQAEGFAYAFIGQLENKYSLFLKGINRKIQNATVEKQQKLVKEGLFFCRDIERIHIIGNAEYLDVT
ncbi:MAG: hypothetical protein EOM19_08450, partial [Candidatus Moranbacteria bacterium]|nr:hypothetical protein [Candidatus Moranbacteria bacterium]